MSLEELLRESKNNSSSWKNQKSRLVRIVGGISVVALALVAGGLFLFTGKDKMQVDGVKTDQQTESLTQLMKLKDQASELKQQVQKLKNKEVNAPKTKVAKPKVYHSNVRARSSAPQIIDYDPGKGFDSLETHKKSIYIPTGAVFQARLITPIKTSLNKTFVMAETTHEFRMDMNRRIPKKSRLIGRSRLDPVLKGVTVEFDTLVLPNGIETKISGLALSRNALPEIEGLYFSNDLENYGTALAFGFLSGLSDASRTRESTVLGSQAEQTLSNQVLSGLSTASFQVAEEILRDIRHRSLEYVVVPAGEPVFVALTHRYNLDQKGD